MIEGGFDLNMDGKDVMITVWKVKWAFYGLLLGKKALPYVINTLARNVLSLRPNKNNSSLLCSV